MSDTQKADKAADGGLRLTPCCVSLVWMPGPANDGEGTAGYDLWWDGETLLVIVETMSGPETFLVLVQADGNQLSFVDRSTGNDDFGYSAGDISWWAKLDGILPHNVKEHLPPHNAAPSVDVPLLVRHLRCRAVIAGDLYREGRITRPEAFRLEMDASLGDDTGPIQSDENTDHQDMMAGDGPDHDEYRRRMPNVDVDASADTATPTTPKPQ